MSINIVCSPTPALEPRLGCTWADTMVLNPAIIKDPESKTIHMLFRSTGPWTHRRLEGSGKDPYPIFLGYAKSEDLGKTWKADFERPALAPAVQYELDKMYIIDDEGNKVPNYTNGCIEDPRIFEMEGQLYLTAACRMFPPGPYWENEPGYTNIPKWVHSDKNPFGKTAVTNCTVTVLYKLDLDKLKTKDYDNAFTYIGPLTSGEITDNRDVFFFPEKMMIDGKMQYVLIHRPHHPHAFEAGKGVLKPSIMLAAAENIKDFTTSKAKHRLLATQLFDWEEERIGASWVPIKISEKEWLFPYHGKKVPGLGYTQSFMILKERENDFPEIIHRCPERLMYAKQEWELPDKFLVPCIFTTGGIVIDDTLIMSYGAADQKAGIAWVNIKELVEHIRKFDKYGK